MSSQLVLICCGCCSFLTLSQLLVLPGAGLGEGCPRFGWSRWSDNPGCYSLEESPHGCESGASSWTSCWTFCSKLCRHRRRKRGGQLWRAFEEETRMKMFPSKGHIWTAFHSRGPEHVPSMWMHSGRLCCIGCKHASYRSHLVQNGWCCAISKHHFSWSRSRKSDIDISSPHCGRSPCGGWCAPPASPRTRTACTSGWSCSLFLQFLNRPTLRVVSCVG